MDQAKILETLVAAGLVAPDDVSSAASLQADTGGQLFETLIRIGAIDEDDLLSHVSDLWGVPLVMPDDMPVEVDAILRAIADLKLDRDWLLRHQALVWWLGPEGESERRLALVGRNPLDPQLREAIDRAVHHHELASPGQLVNITPGLISRSQFDVLKALFPSDDQSERDYGGDTDLARLRELAEEAPIIDLVNQVFAAAIKARASDIHFEPYDKNFDIRFRIDGVIQSWQKQPRSRYDAVSTRIKLISGMDIAERRLPQDGRQSIRLSGQQYDLRVSSLPGAWGESLVLRLLDKNRNLPSLDDLGLAGRARRLFSDLIRNPDGIILVTGPTGSGKSTTLYKALEEINDGRKKIITIEDPIEYEMSRVFQTQVKSDIGYTFASGLRSILRQDPDVIMVGEIRDPETAAIAVQASLTGHLVLSTLHTNSALLAVSRLRDLGLEPFLIGSAIKAFAAQRLVRRICPHCSRQTAPPDNLPLLLSSCASEARAAIDAEMGVANWKSGEGCPACSGTGFLGRVGLFELVAVDAGLRDLILGGANASELESFARKQGFRRLAEDGYEKARSGVTTVSEILRVAASETDRLLAGNV
ncbi:GspE/PulE family protein [Hyphomonas sp.]|uniref:GspE/PulE family protein n=1 Tax=Hyphomonas sp. TaxID=87 RepID=UPI00356745A4